MSKIYRSKARHSTRSKRKQAGDFMVSLSIALIVVAIISAGVFIAFRENTRKNEVKETINAVTATAANLRKNFGINNTYGSVTTAIAVQSRTIPEEQRNPGTTTASNAYGGAIAVAPASLTGTNDAVAISYANVPSSQCVDIVLGTQGIARNMDAGGAQVKPTDGAINLATLATQCEAATNVSVNWYVGRTGT